MTNFFEEKLNLTRFKKPDNPITDRFYEMKQDWFFGAKIKYEDVYKYINGTTIDSDYGKSIRRKIWGERYESLTKSRDIFEYYCEISGFHVFSVHTNEDRFAYNKEGYFVVSINYGTLMLSPDTKKDAYRMFNELVESVKLFNKKQPRSLFGILSSWICN